MSTHSHSVERVTGAMARAQQHWRQASAKGHESASYFQGDAALTIALSPEPGIPGDAIAQAVGARLGWAVYDHELLELIAQEAGWRVPLIESVDERRRNWLTEAVAALAAVPSVSENAFAHHLIETLLSLATHGECVIVGRAAAQALPAATTLRVRLVATLEDRVAALSRQLGVTREEAAERLKEMSHQRTRFVREHFQKDPADPHHYDLLLNTSRWSVADCADIIVDSARRFQAR